MKHDEHRRAALETWEAAARGWERWRDAIESVLLPVREWMLRELAPKPGDTVLELAAGPGDTGFAAAELVGESGRVISTDFSPAMVEIARRRSTELGLGNIEHRTMDAERIALADGSVDGVLCRFGYMLVPDPAAALAETRRVLRPGSRVTLAVWREAARNPWISIVGRMLLARGHVPPPEPDAPGIFALAADERIRELLEGAGFTVRRMEEIPVLFVYQSLDEYIRRARDTGGVFARVWQKVPPGEREELESELEEALAPFEVDGRYALPGVAVAAAAE
ncbi:MAG TPA: class I SAM-dependent methyltransferase [Gaiellaceae bacterium]|nr:class I SAM-dependent methyltransferase [Gaiellaceae bacterium]